MCNQVNQPAYSNEMPRNEEVIVASYKKKTESKDVPSRFLFE